MGSWQSGGFFQTSGGSTVTNLGAGLKTTSAGPTPMPQKTPTVVPARPTHGPASAAGNKTEQRPVVSQSSFGQHLSTFS